MNKLHWLGGLGRFSWLSLSLSWLVTLAGCWSAIDRSRLAGMGPFVSHPGVGIDPDPPPGCSVSQVIVLARHGERYPVELQYRQFELTLARLKLARKLTGSLAFVSDYDMFMCTEDCGQETSSGHWNSRQLGRQIAYAYPHLIAPRGRQLIFASDETRVVESAYEFGLGLLDVHDESRFSVIKIPQHGFGANSLLPQLSCIASLNLATSLIQSERFFESAMAPLVARLNRNVHGPWSYLTSADVSSLYGLCAFELNAVGQSQFCDIFRSHEFAILERRTDILMYNLFGPGGGLAAMAVGSVFVNATMQLLKRGPISHPLVVSFAHDVSLLSTIHALGILSADAPNKDSTEPTDWQIGHISPMLGRVIIERLECSDCCDSYVRVVLNGAVVPILECQDGPGSSCPLSSFYDLPLVPFGEGCGGSPEHATFYWDN